MSTNERPRRKIKSFVKRDSRITLSQKKALEQLSPKYLLSLEEINFKKVFFRVAPVILEIGFGSGKSLVEVAKLHPEKDFIGVEMHLPGIGALLMGMQKEKLENIRVFYADAVEVLSKAIPNESLDGVQIFFPDPWQKRKHHKRRLIQSEFVEQVGNKLKPQGIFHLATDWEDYAIHMMNVMTRSESFLNLAGHGKFAERSTHRPVITKFEARGEKVGRKIWELQFVKC